MLLPSSCETAYFRSLSIGQYACPEFERPFFPVRLLANCQGQRSSRMLVSQNHGPDKGFPYVPRYKTDTYVVEFITGFCPQAKD